MPPDQQAQMDAFRVQQPQAKPFATIPPVGVPAGAPTPVQGQQTQGPQLRPPQVGVPGVVKQGAAFGGTEFFPIPTGNVLQEKFAREYNQYQQQLFKRQRVPQVAFR